jgi:subtilase family serine protease
MKSKLLGTFLTFALLIGSSLPMTGYATIRVIGASPLLEVGPQAISVDATATTDGATYGLFSCQVGRSVGQCYDPYEMRMAYGVNTLISSGLNGTGKTIVIIDAFQDPNIAAQLDYFDNFYGLTPVNAGSGTPTFTQVAPDGLTPFVPGDPNMRGWAEEISLDVLWAHAIAPGANIVLELGADNSDVALVSALNDAINNNRGDVISMSFGESDTCLGTDLTAAWHQAFVNATMKGITLFASSGDQGAALPSCDGNSWIKSTSSPASDPLVTSVGGTELHAADYCLTSLGCDPTANPAPGTYLSEIGWNEGYPYGDFQNVFGSTHAGGGGFSTVWDEPAYQKGTIHGGKQRGVSDVSYNASILHGVLTYLNIPGLAVGWYRFGGTSAGSPQWAALTAIADQIAGGDYGFINAAMYKIGQNATPYSISFNDITSGTNSALEYDTANNPVYTTGYNAIPGWDAFTGLGSPKTNSFVNELPVFWSAGQGNAAIAGSKSHTNGNPNNPGHMKSH